MTRTTGDATTDAFVALATVAIALLFLVAVTAPFEKTARGRRWADRLLEVLFR